MGNYIDIDIVRADLEEDLDGFYTLPDQQQKLEDDIAFAEGIVNSYVGKRYQTPVTDSSALDVLRPITLDVFKGKAYDRGAGPELPAKIVDAVKTAMAMLKDIAEGKATLAGAVGLAERPEGGAEAIIVEGNAPEFAKGHLEGY